MNKSFDTVKIAMSLITHFGFHIDTLSTEKVILRDKQGLACCIDVNLKIVYNK